MFGSVGKYLCSLFAILSQDRLMAAKNVALDCGAIQLGQTLKLPAGLAMLVPPQKKQDRSAVHATDPLDHTSLAGVTYGNMALPCHNLFLEFFAEMAPQHPISGSAGRGGRFKPLCEAEEWPSSPLHLGQVRKTRAFLRAVKTESLNLAGEC